VIDFAWGNGANLNSGRFVYMPHDADYYRARAIEERGHAKAAGKVYLAAIHRELAQQLEQRAEQCDGAAEDFDLLAERASQLIRERKPRGRMAANNNKAGS
jgi:hypothetical protein